MAAQAEGLARGTQGVVQPPGGRAHSGARAAGAGRGAEELGGGEGDGEPVSLAELLLTPLAFAPDKQGHLDAPEEERHYGTSGEAGEFHLTGLAPGWYYMEVRAPGYMSRVLPSVPVPFGRRATINLASGGILEGGLGVEGAPAAGAEVRASNLIKEVTATADGRFAFRDLPPGEHELHLEYRTARGAGTRTHPVKVEPDRALELGDLVLNTP